MKLRTTLALFLAPCLAAAQPGPAGSEEGEPSPERRLDSLTPAQVQAGLDALKQRHIRGAALDDEAMARATLRGLLGELAPGAELTTAGEEEPEAAPFRSEILEGNFGYLRLGSLQAANLAELDKALDGFAAKDVDGVVLDLRATPFSQDFNLSAQAAGRFLAPGSQVFTLLPADPADGKSFTAQGPRRFDGVLVVLVDGDAGGAAEALAGALRAGARAMLVGARTSGRATELASVPLADGLELRLAVAEVRVPDLPAIYPAGLAPDLAVPQERAERDELLAAQLKDGAGAYVFEQARARFNEASLVAGTNPEIGTESPAAGPPQMDRPLQRAVDLITAIRLFAARK
jgi:hypothetical protein